MDRRLTRELAAEFLGTFLLLTFGIAVVAQVVLSKQTAGNYLSINLGWGLAVMIGAYAAAGVSGAHLNPAVTIALAVHRGFPWRKVLPYSLAQIAGAFAGAVLVFLVYREAFTAFDGGIRSASGATATAGIFATYPQPFLSLGGGLLDQIVGTALLIAGILALTDARNNAVPGNLTPAAVGALVVLIGATFGFNAGYAINPARDFGPRLFTFVAGWGGAVFSSPSPAWWLVPIAGPIIGGVAGGFLYDLFITRLYGE